VKDLGNYLSKLDFSLIIKPFFAVMASVFCILSLRGQTQVIEKIYPPAPVPAIDNPFLGIRNGDLLVQDFNGDGIDDVLMVGNNNDYVSRTILYFGQGGGEYSRSNNSNIPVLTTTALASADVDGDGDMDVAIAGFTASGPNETALLYNNGGGVFTKAQIVPFINVNRGALAFADVDGDGDQDLLVAGGITSTTADTELYLNTGNGNFILSTANNFPIMRDGDIEFADVDGDNDPGRHRRRHQKSGRRRPALR
jgi:hypothetical protein